MQKYLQKKKNEVENENYNGLKSNFEKRQLYNNIYITVSQIPSTYHYTV